MTFFKNAPLGLALAVAALALATGCKKDAQGESAPATYFFENVKAAQVIIPVENGFNAWGFPKLKQFKMLACPKDIALMAPIIGQTFEVRDESGGVKALTTDSRGCLQWDELYEYDHFAPETFLDVKRTFVGTGGHTGTVQVSLAVNPWAGQALDVRYETPQQIEAPLRPTSFNAKLVDGQPAAAIIDVKNMSFQFLAIDYNKWEVDPHLKLTVAHNYRLRFEPKVIRKILAQPRTTSETPLRGRVRISVVIVREGRDQTVTPEQYVTHYSETVEMQVGGVIQDVTLKFPDTIAEVASRMRAFIKIVPIVDSPSVGLVKLTSPIGPLPSQTSMQLVPTDVDADTVIAQAERSRANSATAKMKAIEIFEEVSGLKKVVPAQWNQRVVGKGANLSFTQAKSAFSGPMEKSAASALHKHLCHEVYGNLVEETDGDGREDKTSDGTVEKSKPYLGYRTGLRIEPVLERCLRNPMNMLNVEMRDFVDQLQTPVVRRTGFVQQESLVLSNSISISEGESRSSGNSRRASIGYHGDASLGLNLGADLGWNLIDWKPGPPTEPGGPPTRGTTIGGGIGGSKFGFGGKLGGGIRGGFSGEKFWAYSRSVETRSSTSVTANMTRAVIVEAYALDIDVVARRCLIAAPSVEIPGFQVSGVFFCDDRVVHKTTREAYYFINQQGSGASPIYDGMAGQESQWRMFIRGSHIYNSFKQVAADTNIEMVLEPLESGKEGQKDKSISEKAKEAFLVSPMTQDFPGMLSPPRIDRQ